MAAHLPGVIAAMTPIPVIGIPVKSGNDGMDALFSIVQMPPGIPVATVGMNNSLNAAILAAQILAVGDEKDVLSFSSLRLRKVVSIPFIDSGNTMLSFHSDTAATNGITANMARMPKSDHFGKLLNPK